jgi:hypothetical protein
MQCKQHRFHFHICIVIESFTEILVQQKNPPRVFMNTPKKRNFSNLSCRKRISCLQYTSRNRLAARKLLWRGALQWFETAKRAGTATGNATTVCCQYRPQLSYLSCLTSVYLQDVQTLLCASFHNDDATCTFLALFQMRHTTVSRCTLKKNTCSQFPVIQVPLF